MDWRLELYSSKSVPSVILCTVMCSKFGTKDSLWVLKVLDGVVLATEGIDVGLNSLVGV